MSYSSYCEAVASGNLSDLHKHYHDKEYGFPITTDDELFGRLILEINQAGLSWDTILKKQKGFREAYAGFNIEKVANFDEEDIESLLQNAEIIRNRLKIKAAIHNANVILELKKEYGSFKNWLDEMHPKSLEEWIKLFKKTFKFTGKEITNEFLMSSGYLKGAHVEECPLYDEVLKQNPAWAR